MGADVHAVRCLFRTLRDGLRARLLELDAARRARVICRPGPYTIPADGTLQVGMSPMQTFALTAGARTASEIAAELTAQAPVGWTASADGDGALVLTGTTAPTQAKPSQIIIRGGSAAEELGLHPVDSDSTVLALGAPAVRLLERSPERSDVALRLSPLVGIRRESLQAVRPLNSDLSTVRLDLHLVFPGASGELSATQDAIREFAGAVYEVIAEGDGTGRHRVGREYSIENGLHVVVARPLPLTVEPFVLPGPEDMGRVPIAQAYPSFELEVFHE